MEWRLAFPLPVSDFERVTSELRKQGYAFINKVGHPVARMAYFDIYKTSCVVTGIMVTTPGVW